MIKSMAAFLNLINGVENNMVVAHNLLAINANRQLSITSGVLANSTQKLSSGYRINRAADDAAGLSISEKMRKQIRGLTRAAENAQDGISMLQTADGALNEVHDMLQRMNELAIQAANGINSAVDRKFIQDEINEIKAEIDRVAVTTKFNEIYLLDGHLGDPAREGKTAEEYENYMKEKDAEREKQIAEKAAAGQALTLNEMNQLSGLKIVYTDLSEPENLIDEQVTLTGIDVDATTNVVTTQTPTGNPTEPGYTQLKTALEKQIVPQAVQRLIDTFPQTFGYLSQSSIGIGLRLAFESGNTLASVTSGLEGTLQNMTMTYKLFVNMTSLKYDSNGKLTSQSREELENTIIHEMMHAMMFETLTNGMFGYEPSIGAMDEDQYSFPDWFVEGMAQTAAGACYNYGGHDWVAGLDLTGIPSIGKIQSVVKDSQNKIGSKTEKSQYGTGYLACAYLGYLANRQGAISEAGIANGLDILLNDIKSGTSLDQAIRNHTGYNGITGFQDDFGDAASAQFIQSLLAQVANGAGGLVSGNFLDNDLLPDRDLQLHLFKLNTTNDTVTNAYPTGYDVMAGGNAIGGGTPGPNDPTTGGNTGGGTGIDIDKTYYQKMNLHIGAESSRDNKLTVFIEGMGTEQICVHEVDVTTEISATRSIDMVAFGIQQVSTQRSLLGAYQNRLEHTIKNLDNVVENTQASESQIRDTDMAEEMVRYTSRQILQEAGNAMLAQANHSKEGVLQLLQ